MDQKRANELVGRGNSFHRAKQYEQAIAATGQPPRNIEIQLTPEATPSAALRSPHCAAASSEWGRPLGGGGLSRGPLDGRPVNIAWSI